MLPRFVRCLAFAIFAGLGLGCIYVFAPRWGAEILALYSPDVTFFARATQPRIALTIDDSPDADETAAILDVLKAQGSRATFFVIGGKIAGNEALLGRIRAEGHEVGNHTFHGRMSLFLASRVLASELEATDRLLGVGGDARWFRPGSGYFSRGMLDVAERLGYRVALGDIYPLDARLPWPQFHAWYIVRNARPGSIVVLHDGGGRGFRAAETLRRALPALKQKGLSVVTLSELCQEGGPEVRN